MKILKKKNESKVLKFLFLVSTLIVALFLNKRYHFVLDTTSDKRYSVQKASKNIVNSLSEDFFIDVYLGGELPVELKYFKSSIEDFIFSLNKSCNESKIKINYIDLDNVDDAEREDTIKEFRAAKIYPTTFQYKRGKKDYERNIYPVAVVRQKDKKEIVLLLKANSISTLSSMLQSSIENVEYEIVSAIEALTAKGKYKLGILRDHGTPLDSEIKDLLLEAKRYYDYKPIILSKLNELSVEDLDVLLIVRPTERFSEYELYLIDQYIMKGGKVLFFIDPLSINIQEMYEGKNFAVPLQTGIEDLLYKYGVVLNNDLLEDLQCSVHPYIAGYLGNQPQLKVIPWTFNPIFTHFTIHPVVRNIDSLAGRFVSRISTIQVENIIHYGLIYTSSNTICFEAPFVINVERLYKAPVKEAYNYGYVPVAIIAEGKFDSAFANEILLPEGINRDDFVKEGIGSKIFVASASSLITNYKNPATGRLEDLGCDPFLNKEFSNLTFLKNLLRYFTNSEGAIGLEKKSYKMRFLDKLYVEDNRLKIQIVVILLPLTVLFAIGLIINGLRRRKYENL